MLDFTTVSKHGNMYLARKLAYNKKRGTFNSVSECRLIS